MRTTPFDYFAGAVVNPYKCRKPDQMMQFYKLALKIAAGAQFIIPQLGFNLRKLYELKQYMDREGLCTIPVVANVYVPTATIARMMSAGEIAGCVVSDDLIRRLEHEKKPERLERAALMVAAVRELGFAGAHIGGFGLTHKDFMSILDRSAEIGSDWKRRVDELVFEVPGEFYLLPPGSDGLSDGSGHYQLEARRPREALVQRLSRTMHDLLIHPDSSCGRFFGKRLRARADGGQGWRKSFWAGLLAPSTAYRKATLGCVSCGDCIQDHASYAGCTMRWCYKNLRNGPCGGSRTDGSCEADPSICCIWNLVYLSTLGAGEDPARFARTLIPPRDWCLDRTNALANRFAGLDNYCRRVSAEQKVSKTAETND
jgi:methylenetetrahydrofolate reductase (NADPH)